jgi:hypothetical protein
MKRTHPVLRYARRAAGVAALCLATPAAGIAGTSGTNDDSVIALLLITLLLFLLGVAYLCRVINRLASPPPEDETNPSALWRASDPSDDEDDPYLCMGFA